MKKAVFIGAPENVRNVFPPAMQAQFARHLELVPDVVITRANVEEHRALLQDVEVLLGTWGVEPYTEAEVREYFPRLQAFFYAAGTVRDFGEAFLRAGVRLFSGWGANAIPVVEYTVAQIVLAGKSFYQCCRRCGEGDYAGAVDFYHSRRGNYGAKVGLLGAGMIGAEVAVRLGRDHRFEVLCYDPFCSQEKAEKLGVRLATLEEIFSTCDVISNHLANKKEIEGIISRKLLFSMKERVTLINTGRGAQLDEDALCDFLDAHPGACAVLDVTNPEPPLPGSRLYTTPNLFLTPHIAGSYGDEVVRLAEYMYDMLQDYEAGRPCRWEVFLPMLATMA